MKLIILKTLLIHFVATVVCDQKFQQDQFPFPPHFQTPSSAFTSDSSIYLLPESHTPVPYFPMNNLNKLPFQFLPPTGTKAPSMYPTPLPMYLSSTLRFEEDENDENDRDDKRNTQAQVQNRNIHIYSNRANNNTVQQALDKKDNIFNARMYNHQQPIHQTNQFAQSKFEVQAPSYVTIGPKERSQTKPQNPAARRMIVTSEIQRADQGPDQAKASSYQTPQYIQAPGIFISSTTEPAIPIIRLSNEMDLDGSFSYEALGADQTHYVQHSRMENMGSDKEEQVVEGSYSYVGDDGRTYTVHYIADSNGFRATGDHLPVPPPVPEIIQRSVQYNLAEEAKKPPHLRSSWENDDKEYENNEQMYYNNSPQRSFFTGKTPEAFSFGFPQGSNTQNNLITTANTQVPTKTNYEKDQSNLKVNPMPTPQITFLASQGAHNPTTQSQLANKPVNSEKSPLPQLMNYEAEIKDSDQEANKALWRWQYGLNTNTNQNPKNSISRSFAEGDDIVINFSDMTPDQYTHMINTQILPQNAERSINNNVDYNSDYISPYTRQNISKTFNAPDKFYVSTEIITLLSQQSDETTKKQNINNHLEEQIYKPADNSFRKVENSGVHSEIISRQNFIPQSQTATQSYTFEDTSFEPSKITIPSGNSDVNLKTIHKTPEHGQPSDYDKQTTILEPITKTPKTTINYQLYTENSSFRPTQFNSETGIKQETTTTEVPMNKILRENIFLRNFFKPSNKEENVTSQPSFANIKQENNEHSGYHEIKQDKESKYFHNQENTQNEIKTKSKPMEIDNILNFVVLKNHFESIKTKPKNKPVQHFIQSTNVKDMPTHFIQNTSVKDIPTHYMPIKESTSYYVEPNDDEIQKQDNDFRTLNRQQQQELQGLIKNYKVLQRHKSNMQRSQPIPEPQRHIKAFHTQHLPPLGRAGPSMKSYLPPTYL